MRFIRSMIFTAMAAALLLSLPGMAMAKKPQMHKICTMCHDTEPGVLRGKYVGYSEKYNTLQLDVAKLVWVIKYNDKTKGKNVLAKYKKGGPLKVEFTGTDKEPVATLIKPKPKREISPEKLMKFEDMAELTSKSPKEGNYTLIDARPGKAFIAAHLPHTENVFFGKMRKKKEEVLPKDKDKLLVFYCAGIRCELSPSAAALAESLGYTNVKVYTAGIPDWKKNKGLVLSEAMNIKKMNAKEASYVLVDLRSSKEAKKGHIPGAVNIPAKKLKKDQFPKEKNAPIILYGKSINEKAFHTVRGWGYKNVSVLNGGIDAWTKKKGKLAKGKMATKIVYVKRTPKGQVSIEDFTKAIETQPSDKFILDVRDADTAVQGMFKGAVNIPSAEVEDNLSMIPKDKEILVHCNTGVMASNAMELLEKSGYNVKYLDAIVQVSADGTYEITEK